MGCPARRERQVPNTARGSTGLRKTACGFVARHPHAELKKQASSRPARDIYGMILPNMAIRNAERPGKSSSRQRTADGLENHCDGNVTVGSNPTPSAPTSQNRF